MYRVILLLLLFCSVGTYAQDNSSTNAIGQYKWQKIAVMEECTINGKGNGKYTKSKVNDIFHVIALVGARKDTAVIEVVGYKKENQTNRYELYADNSHYFKIPTSYLNTLAIKDEVLRSQLSLGVLYFPFKYRPQKGMHDFSGAFNFGVAIAYTFPRLSWDKWTFSLVSGYSISNVNIDSFSINKNHDILGAVNNFTALSLSGGVLVQHQMVQIGAFVGTDILSNTNNQTFDWHYQGKPWLSIGFGVSIFSLQDGNTKTPKPSNSSVSKRLAKREAE